MKFTLWPAQVSVAWQLMTHRLLIILKARQLGISWLCCGYALWLCLFSPGKLVLLYSQGEREAMELLRRVKSLYERLPDWLRSASPKVTQDNTTVFGWDNGSRVESLPATQKAGRSLTASLVILDEAAFQQFADALMTALKPTIDGGGQLIIISTANGIGNLFHRLWTKAVTGLNGYRAIFLPWWDRPGRDAEWYAAMVAESDDPAKVKQEYPASANEAFLVSGRVRFQAEWIDRQTPHVTAGIPRDEWPEELRAIDLGARRNKRLSIYQLPVTGIRGAIGADIAEGLEGGDYNAATGILASGASWTEAFCLHGHWEPTEFADLLKVLGEYYKLPVVVERNNHGHAVLASLKLGKFSNVAMGLDGRPGWLTNPHTKPLTIDTLARLFLEDRIIVRSQAALDEFQIYRVLENGSTGAPSGFHDDLIMSWAVGIGYLTAKPPSTGTASVGGLLPPVARSPFGPRR